MTSVDVYRDYLLPRSLALSVQSTVALCTRHTNMAECVKGEQQKQDVHRE